MRKIKLNQRRIAAVCATVLIGLSTVTILRQQGIFDGDQQKNAPATGTPDQPPTDNIPSIDGPSSHEDQPKTSDTPTTSSPSTTAGSPFSYTAQAGSSYTEFARQAIASYVETQKVTLTDAQALQAEITLANNAGTPMLEIGQRVTIAQSDISTALRQIGVAQTKNNPTPNPSAKGDYTATAAAGDSFTLHARAAITASINDHKQALSPAQRIAAESYIVAEAGAPQLEVGQTVTITTATITNAVTRAAALSASEQATWNAWATNVVF